jgi:hypothetical protein
MPSELATSGLPSVPTGPAALIHARQVAVIGEVFGRHVAFHESSPAEFRPLSGRQRAAVGR